MKILTNRQITNPVLWEEKDDYGASSYFKVDLEDKRGSRNEIDLGFSVKISNDLLPKLISEGKAKIILHLECSGTRYREVRELKIGENNILLDRKKIEGDLQILPLITSCEKIENYYSNDFHADYKNQKLVVDIGSILAIGKQITYIVDKPKDKLSGVSSIIKVIWDYETKNILLDCSQDKIHLKLPKVDFDLYKLYGHSNEYEKIILSSFIFPSIVNVLCLMSDKEWAKEYDHKRWFRVLKKKLEKEGYDNTNRILRADESLIIAQKIFDYPFSMALKEVERLAGGNQE